MKIADLYKPQTLPVGANIDARYWTDNGDGTYTPTPLLIYNIARDATEYFKKKIVAMDKEEPATVCYGERPIKLGEYHYRDCNVTIVDDYENRMLSREYEIKYAEQTKEVNRRWKEYQKAHPDEFNITLNVQSPALGDHDENAYFNGFHPEDLGISSLGEAVAACSAAMNLLTKYKSDGEHYAELPMNTFDKYMSKKEFKEEHAALKQSWFDELGVPAKVQIPEDKLPTTTGDSDAKFRNKNYEKEGKNPKAGCIVIENFDAKIMNATQDEEAFGKFAEGVITYITSTTREQFMSALSDKLRTIGEEFADKFNDTSRMFKAVESAIGYEIYTKGTTDKAPKRYITLVNMPDRWDMVLSANINGLDVGFKGIVSNYDEFKKNLNIFAVTIGTAGEKDLAADLVEVGESL